MNRRPATRAKFDRARNSHTRSDRWAFFCELVGDLSHTTRILKGPIVRRHTRVHDVIVLRGKVTTNSTFGRNLLRLSVAGRGLPNRLFGMTELTTSFADSGEAVISQKIEATPDLSASNLPANEFAEYYDIERTVDEIIKGNYKSVRPTPLQTQEYLTSVIPDRTPVPR